MLGNYRIVAQLPGVEVGRVTARWTERAASTAPVSNDFLAKNANVDNLPPTGIPYRTFSEKDAGPNLTAHVIAIRDPGTSFVSLSSHQIDPINDSELRCRLSTSGDLFRIQQYMSKPSKGQPQSYSAPSSPRLD